MKLKRVVIAGTRSGVGKTSIATGIIAALTARKLKVRGFKIGPDYIDPGYHTLAAGRPSLNLDTFLMPPEKTLGVFKRYAEDSDIAVIEGVMGLYDGRRDGGEGSTASMARLLNAPVILVVDAASTGQSIAAEVYGFKAFDKRITMAGVILNRVSNDSHLELLKDAVTGYTGLPVVGCLKKGSLPALPSRHLGLVPVAEQKGLKSVIHHFAAAVEDGIDIGEVIRIAATAGPLGDGDDVHPAAAVEPSRRVPIALAMDEAFTFYYRDALDYLSDCGAELLNFSPLRDTDLPKGSAGVIIGGGFPEIFLRELAANKPLINNLQDRVKMGMPVYGECGGLMYLCRRITDREGISFSMAGVIPAECRMETRLVGLGYREGTVNGNSLIGRKGDTVRGHEFHYSRLEAEEEYPFAYKWRTRDGTVRDGYARGNVFASYLHINFIGNPRVVENYLERCRKYS